MGFILRIPDDDVEETQATTLPSPEAAKPHAFELMTRKDKIQAEIDAQLRILSANSANLRTPLVDSEGFPRADIDIVSVRNARVRYVVHIANTGTIILSTVLASSS
jgi:26S proteasome regulatory subunit N4